nr:MAG TPA: RFX DNA-binding domain protein [Caudoviricetes sp.]
MELIALYKIWCKEKGYKPSSGKALHEFITNTKKA